LEYTGVESSVSESTFEQTCTDIMQSILGYGAPSFNVLLFDTHSARAILKCSASGVSAVWGSLTLCSRDSKGRACFFDIHKVTPFVAALRSDFWWFGGGGS